MAILSVAAALGGAGCATATTPTPGPSPSPTYPRGSPNATALENLNFIRGLEDASGRRSVLMSVAGDSQQNGLVRAEGAWEYMFADHDALTSRGTRVRFWTVWPDGRVTFNENLNVSRIPVGEIGPALRIDSPEVARLAREYGAQAYVERYPNVRIVLGAHYLAGRIVWEASFRDTSSPNRPPCELGPIYIDAQTGELLHAELGCLNSLN
jgi:hypothetical protein